MNTHTDTHHADTHHADTHHADTHHADTHHADTHRSDVTADRSDRQYVRMRSWSRARSGLRPSVVRTMTAAGVALSATFLVACSTDSNSLAADTVAAAESSFATNDADFAAADTTMAAQTEPTAAEQSSEPSPSEPNNNGVGAAATAVQTERRDVVYTATADVEVDDAVRAANEIRRDVIAADGWVLQDERVEGRAMMVLKVRPTSFDSTLAALTAVGKVRSQQVSAADVTADMVDLEARLKSAVISRDRLRALLNGAVRVEDLIALESELSAREATIEQITGQLGVLRNRVAYATINLTLFERPVAEVDDTDTTPAEGFHRGWVAMRNTARGVLVALATVAVWLPLLALILVALRWWVRRTAARRPRRVNPTNPGWTPSGQSPERSLQPIGHAEPHSVQSDSSERPDS